ncbi:hypothetical protein OUZ56_026440 [Daphnia magna]|uniref:Uncharacterized protein n=1 Tax=Daphnia magna TaxID=35525 RepID=A0ABQ9ZLR3_9CRUS|nr:hypothetical protein OUZ56_026440 [Daphnia magna]
MRSRNARATSLSKLRSNVANETVEGLDTISSQKPRGSFTSGTVSGKRPPSIFARIAARISPAKSPPKVSPKFSSVVKTVSGFFTRNSPNGQSAEPEPASPIQQNQNRSTEDIPAQNEPASVSNPCDQEPEGERSGLSIDRSEDLVTSNLVDSRHPSIEPLSTRPESNDGVDRTYDTVETPDVGPTGENTRRSEENIPVESPSVRADVDLHIERSADQIRIQTTDKLQQQPVESPVDQRDTRTNPPTESLAVTDALPKLYYSSSSPMMAQIEEKYSFTDIKEKPLKKKIKALWLEKFKKLKKYVSKTLKIKISRPVFSAAIVTSRVTIEKASSHPEEHEDKENHQNGNTIFANESVIRASVLEHQTTVVCIFSIPLPEPTCENAAVTTSASEKTKEQKIAVTSDHLGDHVDQPGMKHLDQLEFLHLILHDAYLTPGDDQRASNAVHQAETFRDSDRPRPTAKIQKRSRGCTKQSLLFAQRRCVLVCLAA